MSPQSTFLSILGAHIPTEALALVATVHLALGILRRHRSAPGKGLSLLPAPGVVLAVLPWPHPTLLLTAAGLLVRAAFWIACEKLLPRPSAPGAGAGSSAGRAAGKGAAPARPVASPKGFVPLPVLAVFDETAEIRTFRLARPAGFDFRPGQFVTVRISVKGTPMVRCYSISSSPEPKGYLEISVRRQGLVSGALHTTLRPGSTLEVKAPAGPFVYPEGERPLVLLAGGVGITPCASMLRHAVLADPGRPVTLLLSVRTEADIPYREELALLSRRHPQARVEIALSRGSSSPGFHTGRIDEPLLRKTVPDPARAVYAICGPGGMIDGSKAILERMGVPREQVFAEAFEAAVAASALEPTDSSAPSRTIRLSVSRKTVEAAPGRTILEAVEDGGVDIPSACRAGSCHTCRSRLVSGEIDAPEGLIAADEAADGWFLPCVSRARTDCVVEA